MEDLHAAIARHLRMYRLVAMTERSTAPASTRYTRHCRICGQEYTSGEGLYHMDELAQAGTCAYCHRAGLRQEEAGMVQKSIPKRHRPSAIRPLCRHCGSEIVTGGELGYDVAKLCAERACAECYVPF